MSIEEFYKEQREVTLSLLEDTRHTIYFLQFLRQTWHSGYQWFVAVSPCQALCLSASLVLELLEEEDSSLTHGVSCLLDE